MQKSIIKLAIKDTIPVLTGYIFLGFGFGILLQQIGLGPLWAVAMSTLIYGGSMQYVAVSLLSAKAGLLTVAITTLLVNARHLFYGITMIDRYKGTGKLKPYLIFALTDETFSLVSREKITAGPHRHKYCFWVSILNHSYWIIGGLLGNIAGSVLPLDYTGIEFVLTALFVTIFVEQWLSSKNHTSAIVGVVSTAVCLLIFGKDVFLIPTMAVMIIVFVVMSKMKKEQKND